MSTPWMDIAWGEEGRKDILNQESAEPSMVTLFRSDGRADIPDNPTTWSASFVGVCLERSGVPSQIDAGDALIARSYLRVGTEIDKPRTGAIVVFEHDGENAWQGRTGFAVGSTANTVAVLGGNAPRDVNVTHVPRSSVWGYRWPTPPKKPDQIAAEGSRTVKEAKGTSLDAAGAGGAVAVPPAASQLPPMPSLPELASKTSEWRTILEQLSDFGNFLGQNIYSVGAVVGLYFVMRIIWRSRLIEYFRTDDANIGKTNA